LNDSQLDQIQIAANKAAAPSLISHGMIVLTALNIDNIRNSN